MAKKIISQELLHELFEYQNGKLFWKKSRTPAIKTGDEAGCLNHDGYRRVGIGQEVFSTHRLTFLYHHGYMPEMIDHIDGNTQNNKIENLRECNYNQNNHNAKMRKDNTSGIKGVSFHKVTNKWRARVMVEKKSKELGLFDSIQQASEAVIKFREQLHNDFHNHG